MVSWWNGLEVFRGEKGRATKGLIENLFLAVVLIGTKFLLKTLIHLSVESERLVKVFDAAADLLLVLPAAIIVGAGALEVVTVVCRETYRSISGKEE